MALYRRLVSRRRGTVAGAVRMPSSEIAVKTCSATLQPDANVGAAGVSDACGATKRDRQPLQDLQELRMYQTITAAIVGAELRATTSRDRPDTSQALKPRTRVASRLRWPR
jgi:hypothetical protein